MKLSAKQQRDGNYVLTFGGVTVGGSSFLEALRELYRRVPEKHRELVKKIGADTKLKGFMDGLNV